MTNPQEFLPYMWVAMIAVLGSATLISNSNKEFEAVFANWISLLTGAVGLGCAVHTSYRIFGMNHNFVFAIIVISLSAYWLNKDFQIDKSTMLKEQKRSQNRAKKMEESIANSVDTITSANASSEAVRAVESKFRMPEVNLEQHKKIVVQD